LFIPGGVEGSAILSYRSTRVSLVTMSRRVLVNSNPRNDKALVVERYNNFGSYLALYAEPRGCDFFQPM
jgi:hypothetical protein